MSDEQLLIPREVAERIGVSDQTIYNWIADGVDRLRSAYEEIVEGNNSGLAVAA